MVAVQRNHSLLSPPCPVATSYCHVTETPPSRLSCACGHGLMLTWLPRTPSLLARARSTSSEGEPVYSKFQTPDTRGERAGSSMGLSGSSSNTRCWSKRTVSYSNDISSSTTTSSVNLGKVEIYACMLPVVYSTGYEQPRTRIQNSGWS